MATLASAPPPPVSTPTSSTNDLLISITPWTSHRRSSSNDVPESVSPSKRMTRSSRQSTVVGDENEPTVPRSINMTPGNKPRYLLDAVTPSLLGQTNLSTPLVPSAYSIGLLRSALKRSQRSVSYNSPLQEKDSNSRTSTPTWEMGSSGKTTTITTGGEGGGNSAGTPSRSPTKTLRFHEDVLEREIGKNSARKGKSSRRSSLNMDGNDADRDAEDEEWISDSENEVDTSCAESAPATPISTLPLHLLPQTPSAYSFCPSTPLVRTHGSYEEDELTDCDADFSVYDEEASFAFTNVGKARLETMAEDSRRAELVVDESMVQSFEDEKDHEEEEEEEEEEKEEGKMVPEHRERTEPENRPGYARAVHGGPEPEADEQGTETAEEESRDEVQVEDDNEACEDEMDLQDEGRVAKEADATQDLTPEDEGEAESRGIEALVLPERPVTPDAQATTVNTPPSPFLRPSSASASSPYTTTTSITPELPQVATTNDVPATPAQPQISAPPDALPQTTSVTPSKTAARSNAPRLAQPHVRDAPTARRQLTKLSSLSSKRSFDSLQDPKRRTALTTITPGSAAVESRKLLATGKIDSSGPSTSALSTTALPSRPPPSSSRLLSQSSTRSRIASDPATSQLSTVDENQPPCRGSSVDPSRPAKLSSSIQASKTTLMKPPISTIPRPRSVLARSGIKPPASSTVSSIARATPLPARALPSTTKPTTTTTKPLRPLPTSLSRSVPPVRSARPDSREIVGTRERTLPSPAPRALPSLQQTSSAPSVLGSNRGPTPPLQQARSNGLPPVPRSARPVNHSRTNAASSAALSTAVPGGSTELRPISPETAKALQPVLITSRIANAALPLRSLAEISAEAPSAHAAPAAPILPSSPSSASESAPVPIFASPSSYPVGAGRSPRRAPPSSPLRSPRRVPLSQPIPPAFPSAAEHVSMTSVQSNSVLSLPADKLVATSASDPIDVFGSTPTLPVPIRSTRVRSARPAPLDQNGPVVPASVPVKRVTRRTAAAAASTTISNILSSAAPPSTKFSAPLIPRSSRRPPKPAAIDEAEDPETETSSTPDPAANLPFPLASVPLFICNPVPVLTQEELNRLTQRNTKKNQQSFNKIKIETVYLEENRPPSPTSKIRKSFGVGEAASKEASKEGREARAAKRKRALRSSTDGSELETLRAELGEGEATEEAKGASKVEPIVHFRAPGDEEQFCSPARPVKKSGGKKKSSSTTTTSKKQVRWDKALVYEGPKGDALTEAVKGILNQTSLDKWGNSTETSTNFAKPSPVVIRKRVFRDDEQE
ncbi:hypothetical protein JCM16303_000627 [Sporobolomyces ruberrimus]